MDEGDLVLMSFSLGHARVYMCQNFGIREDIGSGYSLSLGYRVLLKYGAEEHYCTSSNIQQRHDFDSIVLLVKYAMSITFDQLPLHIEDPKSWIVRLLVKKRLEDG